MKKRILILGGGFAGLAAVNKLSRRAKRDISVTLIDRNESSVFAPLLPDLISGGIRARHLLYDLRSHCRKRHAKYICDEILEIDTDKPGVRCHHGFHDADAIIICMGCETNYHGRNDIKALAPGLKSIADSKAISQGAMEAVHKEKPANLLIVGGGYTGLEIAGHLALLLHRKFKRRYSGLHESARITVLERGIAPLKGVSDGVWRHTEKYLGKFGIEIRCECTLESLAPDGQALLSDGHTFNNASVVWAAGVTSGEAINSIPDATFKRGRLDVNSYLQMHNNDCIFAAGDAAAAHKPGESNPLRMGVQFSLAAGSLAAGNALNLLDDRELEVFDPFDPGYLIPLAPGRATGVICGLPLSGRIPLMMHYAMCSMRSWSMRNRFGVLKDLLSKPDNEVGTLQHNHNT